MPRIEMTEIDQQIFKVQADSRTRVQFVYHNHNTGEQWLAASVSPLDAARYREALAAQNCEIIISNSSDSHWNSLAWLAHYRKDAPLDAIRAALKK